jgi:hypothetical protein
MSDDIKKHLLSTSVAPSSKNSEATCLHLTGSSPNAGASKNPTGGGIKKPEHLPFDPQS